MRGLTVTVAVLRNFSVISFLFYLINVSSRAALNPIRDW